MPVQNMAVGQTKRNIGGAACRIDFEFLFQPAQQAEHLIAGIVHGADRHDERIDNNILVGNPVIRGALNNFLATAKRTSGSIEIPVSSLEMATTAAPYLFTSGKTSSRRFVLAGDRIYQRLALIDREPSL